jgi:hypothetical protein
MQVEIDGHGRLCVTPAIDCGEYRGVEAYALRKWVEDNPNARNCHVRICFSDKESMEGQAGSNG